MRFLMIAQKKWSKIVESNLWFEVFSGGNISESKYHVWIGRGQNILNAVRNIVGSVATVDDEDFVANFETQFIKSHKNFDPSILGSKEIIQSILKKKIWPYSGMVKLLFI